MDSGVPTDRPVLATYLHLPYPAAFRPSFLREPNLLVRDASPSVSFYRFLYDAVGSGFSWVDRLAWTDAELAGYLTREDVTIIVLEVSGEVAGYAELVACTDEPGTELKYFGILPGFHGRGFGKHLLSTAVQRAFHGGASRVWLSTRSTDSPHAIANYEARGFTAYRTAWEPAPVHPSRRGS